jgi:hypothetical protein
MEITVDCIRMHFNDHIQRYAYDTLFIFFMRLYPTIKTNTPLIIIFDGVLTEIARLEGLLTDGTITDVSERAAIRNEKAALYGNLLFLQQQAAQQCREFESSHNKNQNYILMSYILIPVYRLTTCLTSFGYYFSVHPPLFL